MVAQNLWWLTVVNPSEDFFFVPCGSIGDLEVVAIAMQAIGRGAEGCHDAMW